MSKSRKPVSEKQLAANRANAARSTGPRTPQGKARSAPNARTHGLTAEKLAILRIENPEEIDRMISDTVAAYQPLNSEELFAVERIALSKIALLRAARLEAGLFTTCLHMSLNHNNIAPMVPLDPTLTHGLRVSVEQNRNFALADGFERMAQRSNSFSLFLRYQAQAERQYRRAVEAFESAQSAPRRVAKRTQFRSATRTRHTPLRPFRNEPGSACPTPARDPRPNASPGLPCPGVRAATRPRAAGFGTG